LINLVNNPGESLNVELKTWIDPETPAGEAKIVRACLAMYHSNGGVIIFGFDDRTLQPSLKSIPGNTRDLYHPDTIQALVSKYASSPFPVEVKFIERDGTEYPILCIEAGIRTPVATKRDLKGENGKLIIKKDAIFVRSLNSNGVASTTEATYGDWERLINFCFDNREADIGRFVRRHFKDLTKIIDRESITSESIVDEIIKFGMNRFTETKKEQSSQLPQHGAFEVALLIPNGPKMYSANQTFLNLINSSNPYYSGFPFWKISTGIKPENRPYVFQEAWEALLVNLEAFGFVNLIDFWRVDPKGRFYHRRALYEDLEPFGQKIEPMQVLDFTLPIWFVAEVIALGIQFARNMEVPSDERLLFKFRWSNLKGRRLASIFPGRQFPFLNTKVSYSDEIVTDIGVAVDTPESALFQHVHEALKRLYEAFDGFEIPKNYVEQETGALLAHQTG